jgi:hypothetical protein
VDGEVYPDAPSTLVLVWAKQGNGGWMINDGRQACKSEFNWPGSHEKRSKAVISLAHTQIHKFTKDHWGTVPNRMVSSLFSLFLGGFVGEWATNNAQMHKLLFPPI